MNPKLTKEQQRTICSELGNVKLKLLYKATVDGFTGAAFHQKCDSRSSTVSVGYNTSGFVFGGFTKKPFSQIGQYVRDDQAFLFTFSGEKLVKYPVTNAQYAVYMHKNYGPYFGNSAMILVNGKGPNSVYTSPGQYYNFTAAEMHGNDQKLTECEVYQVDDALFANPWRMMTWQDQSKKELMESIKTYKPIVSSVPQARVLMIGPVGAGKSSFFNSINSVFRGHVTSQAMSGKLSTSITTQFRTYSLKNGREGKPLPIVLCDTMGLEEGKEAALDVQDISSILHGHMLDHYQFNPGVPLDSGAHGYRKSPDLKDKIHCVVYVLDASTISIMPTKIEKKLEVIRKKVNLFGIPQLILLTKVDEACPLVEEDLKNVYHSFYIKKMMQKICSQLGMPLSCVAPVKNYTEEWELDLNCDILLLNAVKQMLRFADNYFDEISDKLGNLQTK